MKSSALAHNFLFASMNPNAPLPYQKKLQIQLHPNSIKSLSSIILNKYELESRTPIIANSHGHCPYIPHPPHKTFDLFLPPLPNPLQHNGLNFIEMNGIEITPN
jgi:hypothetical protein